MIMVNLILEHITMLDQENNQNAALFLYPKEIWFHDISIIDIVEKEDNDEYFNNSLKYNQRVINQVLKTEVPEFIKIRVVSLLESKRQEIYDAYNNQKIKHSSLSH